MEMTTIKTLAVFAIIFGCFAILYPKIFHPMILHIFGLSQPNQNNLNDPEIRSRLPKHMRDALNDDERKASRREGIPPHMRGGPHPGLRAAAEMKKQAAAQQGANGKGMMGVVLPMYAIGIVIYLIYTMTKVFGRKDGGDKDANGDYLSSHFSDVRYNADKQKFVAGSGKEDSEETMQRKVMQKQKELEKLLMKADSDDINDVEMSELKKRLLETEAQMAKILQAMEAVQQKVVSSFDAAGKMNASVSSPVVQNLTHSEAIHSDRVANSDDEDEMCQDDSNADEIASDSSVEELVMEKAPVENRNHMNLADEFRDEFARGGGDESDSGNEQIDEDVSDQIIENDSKCIPSSSDLRRRAAPSNAGDVKQ